LVPTRRLAETTRLFDGVAAMLPDLDAIRLGHRHQQGRALYRRSRRGLPTAGTIAAGTRRRTRSRIPLRSCTPPQSSLPPSRCIYVGDDRRDIDAGNAAACRRWCVVGYLGNGAPVRPARGWLGLPAELFRWLDFSLDASA
jgi:hypothetical protein